MSVLCSVLFYIKPEYELLSIEGVYLSFNRTYALKTTFTNLGQKIFSFQLFFILTHHINLGRQTFSLVALTKTSYH